MIGPPLDTPPLRLGRIFRAPAAAGCGAWRCVEVLERWWPAGRGRTTPVAEVDLPVGDRLRLVMRDQHGGEYGGEGRYVEVTRPTGLVFAWPWDESRGGGQQLVEVASAEIADAGTVVLVNRGFDGSVRTHREGRELSLDNLARVLAEPIVPEPQSAGSAS